MTSINLSCVICTESYKNTDSVSSTTCGHVFHTQCLTEWRSRSSNCPECRQHIPLIYRLYLNFEERTSQNESELKTKLEESLTHGSILQQQLDASERDLLNLHKEYSKKDAQLSECYKKIEILSTQNSINISELEIKTVEIHKLQEALKSNNPEAPCTMLTEEIEILKEKNKQITAQLHNEIRNTTQLTTDKMRLESMLELAKSMSIPPPTPMPRANLKNDENQNIKFQNNTRSRNHENPKTSGGGYPNRGCIQSAVIRNVKGTFADEQELKNFVFKLTDIMDLFFSGDDIEKVTIMERKNKDTMSLIAKFKTVSLKAQFLTKKDRLKLQPDMKHITLNEYVSDQTNSLFHYARTLKPLGFKHIYIRNNTIFIRKEDGSIPMRIHNRSDIDKLKSESQTQSQ